MGVVLVQGVIPSQAANGEPDCSVTALEAVPRGGVNPLGQQWRADGEPDRQVSRMQTQLLADETVTMQLPVPRNFSMGGQETRYRFVIPDFVGANECARAKQTARKTAGTGNNKQVAYNRRDNKRQRRDSDDGEDNWQQGPSGAAGGNDGDDEDSSSGENSNAATDDEDPRMMTTQRTRAMSMRLLQL
jgi:hypothetical protein